MAGPGRRRSRDDRHGGRDLIALALVGAASALSMWGTRLAAVGFLGAAVAAATSADPLAPAIVWPGATAAGLIVWSRPARRFALPALGMIAALVAASATNAAGVLPAWMVSQAAVALSARGRPGRRWTLALAAADLPVIAGVVAAVASGGFAGWRAPLSETSAMLFALGALARAPLVAGPPRAAEAGVVGVRAQAVALLTLAGDAVPAEPMLVAGALVFAVGAWTHAGRRDGVQEIGLAGAAIAVAAAGGPGWLWGTLAAGTLLHLLASASRPSAPAGRFATAAVASGGIGSPFWPAIAGVGVAAGTVGGIAGSITVLGLVAGAGARLVDGGRAPVRRPAPGGGPARTFVAPGLAVAAAALGLWAPLGAFGSIPATSGVPWPPAWGLIVLAVGAAAGMALATRLAPSRPRRPADPGRRPELRPPEGAWATSVTAAAAGAAVLAAAAVAVWVLGWLRGFL